MAHKYSDEWWEEESTCGVCQATRKRSELTWVNDMYGIPYKQVCADGTCEEEAENQLQPYDRSELDW